jgi:hypothetical protein
MSRYVFFFLTFVREIGSTVIQMVSLYCDILAGGVLIAPTSAPTTGDGQFAAEEVPQLLNATRHWIRLQASGSAKVVVPRSAKKSLIQEELDRSSAYRGCREGKIGAMSGMAAFTILMSVNDVWQSATTTALVGTGMGFALFGAGIGKMAGILIARRRLRKLLRDHQSEPGL